MGKRRKAREIVLQSLYEAEFSDRPWEEILDNQIDRRSSSEETVEYARDLLCKTLENLEHLDAKLASTLENWEMERVSLVDKCILRFALAEIMYFLHVPSKVIINEAIEVAHKYSSQDAGKFVNGVLDRLVHEFRGKAA
ncbi:MAG: transcription antitermination factor NusB [Candidatus Latescibacteria bacterium]|nr:transcription antitermination factor NusB [Candidatus Latescibacterota bacterium]NIM21102.1 transcription antitermination factor NusB [Candidatus Latescibacterota bacterium]NIM65237.1 transcription antitermination factor NusB [Candidatus Latescibacterota bacterium]NIO01752.1 transcription antitermination factor NusB [Candidatus Latescibacterota bacterium]NIO28269.1 transcription antitermination factor NusB [Candidatus Latescibacterota bacterium]